MQIDKINKLSRDMPGFTVLAEVMESNLDGDTVPCYKIRWYDANCGDLRIAFFDKDTLMYYGDDVPKRDFMLWYCGS
jgi:hypothetical protein